MRTSAWRMSWERHEALQPRHRHVLLALSVSMGADGGQTTNCRPSVAAIQRRTGYSDRTIRRTLQELEIGTTEARSAEGRYAPTQPVQIGRWISTARQLGAPSRYYALDNPGTQGTEVEEPTPEPMCHQPRNPGYRQDKRDREQTPSGPPGLRGDLTGERGEELEKLARGGGLGPTACAFCASTLGACTSMPSARECALWVDAQATTKRPTTSRRSAR